MDKGKLLENLDSEDYLVQKKAIRQLVKYNEPCVINRLVDLLQKNKSKMIEEVLMESFKKMGGSYLISSILGLLGHNEISIRSFAFELLMDIGNQDAGLIIQQIDNNDRNVRKFIIDILGSIKSREAVSALVSRLDDEDVNVVQGAVEALGNIGDGSVVEQLVEILPVSHLWVQYTILDVLTKMGNDNTFSNILKMPWDTETGIYGSIFNLLKQNGNVNHIEELLGLCDRIMLQIQIQVLDTILSVSASEEVEYVANILNSSNIIYNLKIVLSFNNGKLKNKLLEYLVSIEKLSSIEILEKTLFDEIVASVIKDSVTCDKNDEYHINLFKCLKFFDSNNIKDILADTLKNGKEPYMDIALEIVMLKSIYEFYPLLVELLRKDRKNIEVVKIFGSWPVEYLNLEEIYQLFNSSDDELKYYILTEILQKVGYGDDKLAEAVGQLLKSVMLEDGKLLKVIEIASNTNNEGLIPFLELLYDCPNIDISIAATEAAERLRQGENTYVEKIEQR